MRSTVTTAGARRLGAGVLALLLTMAAACSDDSSSDDDGSAGDEAPEADGSADTGDGGDGSQDGEAAGGGDPVPSAGCDGSGTGQLELEESTLEVAGTERRYLLSAPAWEEGDDPRPLVVDVHGLAEGAEVHAEMSQLGPLGVEEGFATVFPHGTGEPVHWEVGTDPEENDDLVYLGDVLDRLEEELCLDVSRVYATGLSNGAMMASTLACTMTDRFAAVAPVAGIQLPEGCDPSRPIPVLTWHGTADPILLFNGGVDPSSIPLDGDVPDVGADGVDDAEVEDTASADDEPDLEGEGYPESVAGWAELNGCEDSFEDEEISEEVLWRRYDCPDEAPVEFVIVLGGGHTWPGSDFSASIEEIVGPTTFDVDASRDMWEFFSQHQLPQ